MNLINQIPVKVKLQLEQEQSQNTLIEVLEEIAIGEV